MIPSRVAFYLGPLEFKWYGILVVGGAIVGAFIAAREAARRGEDPDRVWDILLWVLPAGLIGARLYHVVSAWDLYKDNLLAIVTNWTRAGHLRRGGRRHPGPVGLLPPEQAQPRPLDGHCRARPDPGPGHRPLGQLLQPGALRSAHRPALGPVHRAGLPLSRAGQL